MPNGLAGCAVAPDARATAATLAAHRPDLLAAYQRALPAARAAILGRLWGALAREPIPGLGGRRTAGDELMITLADGRRLRGAAAAAVPFGGPVSALRLAGARFDDPARLVEALFLPGHPERLARELDNSVANLALALAANPWPASSPLAGPDLASGDGPGPDGGLAAAEQSIVDGHPLHPCCRTRIGLSTLEVLAYAPEHRAVVDLHLVDVPPDRWLCTGTGVPPILPVHPGQLDRVLATGLVHPTGRTMPARALMSLRTVAPIGQPDRHLKTALEVQMTSAVRLVSAAAVHNGPVVSTLLADLGRRLPGFGVLREVAGGAVRRTGGEPAAGLAAVWREAPRPGPGERILPLAALAAPAGPDGRPLAVAAVEQGYPGRPGSFVTDLAATVLPPLLRLLHLGVALEAHGQNTLVVLRGGHPVRMLYRDIGGVRLSPRRLTAAGLEPPPLRGELAEDDPDALRTKLFAGVLSTVLAELVVLLTRWYGMAPDALWARVGAVARTTYAELPAADADAAALFGGTVPVKAMTAMRLADDPTRELWASLPNPLAGLA